MYRNEEGKDRLVNISTLEIEMKEWDFIPAGEFT